MVRGSTYNVHAAQAVRRPSPWLMSVFICTFACYMPDVRLIRAHSNFQYVLTSSVHKPWVQSTVGRCTVKNTCTCTDQDWRRFESCHSHLQFLAALLCSSEVLESYLSASTLVGVHIQEPEIFLKRNYPPGLSWSKSEVWNSESYCCKSKSGIT